MSGWFGNIKIKLILTATVALRNLRDQDLLIFISLIENLDTNKAYADVINSNDFLVKMMSRHTFFQSVNYL